MKQALTLITAAYLTLPLAAVEYVTLSNSNRLANIPAGALVEIVGVINPGYTLKSTFRNGDVVNFPLNAASLNHRIFDLQELWFGNVALPNEPITIAITLKITPASEIDSAGPKTVLVIPEGSTGDYDVVIESSGDMVTWTPMHSQGVTGSGPQQFFRTRIIKK